jgi:hypothetical protein
MIVVSNGIAISILHSVCDFAHVLPDPKRVKPVDQLSSIHSKRSFAGKHFEYLYSGKAWRYYLPLTIFLPLIVSKSMVIGEGASQGYGFS